MRNFHVTSGNRAKDASARSVKAADFCGFRGGEGARLSAVLTEHIGNLSLAVVRKDDMSRIVVMATGLENGAPQAFGRLDQTP